MAANSGYKVHGKRGAIYIGTTKVATKTEWTLNLNRDYVDATVFGDTNKTYLVGLKDISGTYAGLYFMYMPMAPLRLYWKHTNKKRIRPILAMIRLSGSYIFLPSMAKQ